MSIFHGKQHKGAMRDHKWARYAGAVGRQLRMHDRGYYLTNSPGDPKQRCTPVAVEKLMRPGDTVDSFDWRSWAEEL